MWLSEKQNQAAEYGQETNLDIEDTKICEYHIE